MKPNIEKAKSIKIKNPIVPDQTPYDTLGVRMVCTISNIASMQLVLTPQREVNGSLDENKNKEEIYSIVGSSEDQHETELLDDVIAAIQKFTEAKGI